MATTNASLDTNKGPIVTNRHALLSPTVIVLGALLLLQLLTALILGLGGKDMEPTGTPGPLLAFERDQVTGIRIQVPDGEPVLVAKTGENWVIPALDDLRAAQSKVSDLLSKLGELEKGLPVATSKAALKRFKVAEHNFERKLTLEGGGSTLATLYLGDSPGFRRLFVRADGDQAIYEGQIGLFDAPDKPDAWSDRTLLYLNKDNVQGLTIGGLTLERKDDGWQITDLTAGEQQDPDAVEDLIRMLTSIDFVGVLGADAESAISQEVPPLKIEAVLKSGETIGYRIAKLTQDNDYLLEVSNRPQRFKLAAYAAEELTRIARADLLHETEQAMELPSSGTPPADAADVTSTASSTNQLPELTGSPQTDNNAALHPATTQPVHRELGTGSHEETAPKREP